MKEKKFEVETRGEVLAYHRPALPATFRPPHLGLTLSTLCISRGRMSQTGANDQHLAIKRLRAFDFHGRKVGQQPWPCDVWPTLETCEWSVATGVQEQSHEAVGSISLLFL
jgi:hypothetical protein